MTAPIKACLVCGKPVSGLSTSQDQGCALCWEHQEALAQNPGMDLAHYVTVYVPTILGRDHHSRSPITHPRGGETDEKGDD